MRVLPVFLTILLILTACAPASVPANPSPVPTKPVIVSAEVATEFPTITVKGILETSLLATTWKGSQKGNVLFPVDPASGTALPDYPPISLGYSSFHAFSPDRHTLAVVSFPGESTYNGNLLLIDLPRWKTQRFDLGLKGWARTIVFSPDGGRLAIAHGESTYQVTLFDLEQEVIIAQEETDSLVTKMQFTRDGQALMLYGQMIENRFMPSQMSAGAPQVNLLNGSDLSPIWSAELKDIRDGVFPKDETVTAQNLYEPGNALYMSPGLAFAPDKDVFYIVHADSEQLTTVDFEHQKIETVKIQTRLTWFERLLSLTAGVAHAKMVDGTSKQAAISPDGRFLYVTGVNHSSFQDQLGNWQTEQTLLGLEIIHTSDGGRMERFETDAAEMSLSPDGRFLYLRNWGANDPWTEIYDLSNRRLITRKEKTFAIPALLTNGQFLLASTYSTSESSHHMSVLEPDGSSVLAEWTDSESIWWLTP